MSLLAVIADSITLLTVKDGRRLKFSLKVNTEISVPATSQEPNWMLNADTNQYVLNRQLFVSLGKLKNINIPEDS